MIDQSIYERIVSFSSLATLSSIQYSDYDDLKDCEVLVDHESLKVLYRTQGVRPVIEYVSIGVEPLFNYLKDHSISGVLHFVPDEMIPMLESIGFSVLAQFTDFFCNPLVDNYPSESVSIELAVASDAQRLAEISQKCVGISRGFFGETEAWFKEWMSEHPVLVIKEHGQIIGLCCVSVYNEGTTLWIREMCVDPVYQRQGVGNQLMKAAIKYGVSQGCIKSFLAVDVENHSAIRIYQSYGFTHRDNSVETHMVRNQT